jgi:serine/threonine protein kinase
MRRRASLAPKAALAPALLTKEGWMRKQSGFFKSWKPHYFTLANAMLSYATGPGVRPKGQIAVRAARLILSAPECRRQPAFKICIPPTRTYYFVCESAKEVHDWLAVLDAVRLGSPAAAPPRPRRIGIDDFEPLRLIGRGAYGQVQLVRHCADGRLYAMKTMNKQVLADYDQVDQIMRERDVLLQTVHPFLVGAHFTFQNDASIFLVLDYVPGGELFQRLRVENRFSEGRTRLYAAEILLGLGHLHGLGFIYRDLKPENILVDAQGHLKLTDFGLVKALVGDHATTSTFCGTPEYLAPEMVQQQPYTKAVDWWSFGCLVYEMLVGLPPFYNENKNHMFRQIMESNIRFPPLVSPNARDLIWHLLDKNPESRLGAGPTDFQEMQGHPFFASLDWDAVANRMITPEWVPQLANETDVSNFDDRITSERVLRDWAPPSMNLRPTTPSAFTGFTCVNESRL